MTIAVGLLAGAWGFSNLEQLPGLRWLAVLWIVAVLFWIYCRPALWLPVGFAVAWLQALQHPIPDWQAGWVGQDVDLQGRVVSLPSGDTQRQRFEFLADPDPALPDGRLLLSWYDSPLPVARAGERWQLRVRLRPPSGMRNPGGFDYEGYLFRKGIVATGYVRGDGGNRRLGVPRWHDAPVNRLRAAIRERLRDVLDGQSQLPILLALTLGDRSTVDSEQWAWLQASGLAHLVAISGLHIGLVSGLVYLLVSGLWRRMPYLCRRWPAPPIGVMAGLLAGLAYAMLAGMTLPTLRAWIMLAVAALALLLMRDTRPVQAVSLALIVVLLLDPLAVSDPGLWLSFGAVAFILWVAVGRGRIRRRLLPVQWTLAIGLLPISLAWFGRVSLVAPLANLIAVPVVGAVVVPLALLGVLLLLSGIDGQGYLLQLAGVVMAWLGALAQWLLSWPGAEWWPGSPPAWTVPVAVVSAFWLLLPAGWPARWLGVIGLIPLLWLRPGAPGAGAFELTLLDVGQGLATVVRTQNHVLVFDTGPAFRSGNDTGALALVPYLRGLGVRRVDHALISHGDLDHRGGLNSLAAAIPVDRVSRGGGQLPRAGELVCQAGQHWQWDGVRFRVLWPLREGVRHGNNGSCVLRVENDHYAVLLTGDIEAAAERALLRRGADLRADLLIAPHHGSNSSSTAEFLDAVAPERVWFPAGFANRWGFPKAQVLQRLAERDIRWRSTGDSGALRLRMTGTAPDFHYEREALRRYWQRPVP